MLPLTPVAHSLAESEIAGAVARRRLASRVTDHPVAPLSDLVQMGRAVGLSMAEMQRVTGVARQTIYRQLPAQGDPPRRPSRQQATIEVLILLAAEGDFASPAVMARRAGLDPVSVTGLLTDLDGDGLCEVRRDSYASLEARPVPATYAVLREHFDDLFLRRPDAISMYLRLQPGEETAVAQAAGAIVANLEFDVIEQTVAPSTMVGPELAFTVNAPTIRRALNVARDVWREVQAARGLPFTEPVIANVIPAGARAPVTSTVLDAFIEAITDSGAPNGAEVREVRDGFGGGVSEAELAGRCVTMAALALRRAVGNEGDPRSIVDGDSAFAEYQPASGAMVHMGQVPVKKAAVAALDLAVERLGPLPGGRLGSVRAPGAPPVIVRDQTPSGSELTEMARFAGEAVGFAATESYVDAAQLVRRVVAGD
ncbi:MAG: hypothetical protein ACR2LK_04740 [Solirubrobacteraceae bacterium]